MLIFEILIILGVLYILFGVPLILEKIKRNYWYGFRVKKTMSNDLIWYKANKFTGWCLLFSGIFIILGSIILRNFLEEFTLFLILVTFSLLIITVLPFIYLKKL